MKRMTRVAAASLAVRVPTTRCRDDGGGDRAGPRIAPFSSHSAISGPAPPAFHHDIVIPSARGISSLFTPASF